MVGDARFWRKPMKTLVMLAAVAVLSFSSAAFGQAVVDEGNAGTDVHALETENTTGTCPFKTTSDYATCALGAQSLLIDFKQQMESDTEGTPVDRYFKHAFAFYTFRKEYNSWLVGLRDDGLLEKGTQMHGVVQLSNSALINAWKTVSKLHKTMEAYTAMPKRRKD